MHDFTVRSFNPAFRGCQNPINGLCEAHIATTTTHLARSDFYVEVVSLVRDLEDLSPGEAVDS